MAAERKDAIGFDEPAGKTIGLCMIVKDEAAVIERCLDSVRPLIDYVLIEDTGSTDRTQKIIRVPICAATASPARSSRRGGATLPTTARTSWRGCARGFRSTTR